MQTFKKFFQSRSLVITILVFVFIWGLSFIPINCAFLDPVAKALGDFDVYDIAYSKLLDEQQVDTNIVLVNIGNLSREEIAQQINNLNYFSPRVIGIDAFFEVEKDHYSDSLLADAFSKCRDLVLVSKLQDYNEGTDKYGDIRFSINKFGKYAGGGYANLPNDDAVSFRTIREFKPKAVLQDSFAYCFAAAISKIYDEHAFQYLIDRDKDIEKINFRGNYNKYYFIDAYQSLDPYADFSFIKDKIVLMGYMGPDINTPTLEDIFFTPLNERYAGKSFPDMYGIVIHANIISMILQRSYIEEMPEWITTLIAVFFCFLCVRMLVIIKEKFSDWFNFFATVMIFVLTILNLLLSVQILHQLKYKVSLTLTMIAIALSPTIVELYENFFKQVFKTIKQKKIKA